MDISKVEKILKVCKLIAQMPSGAGWVQSKEIVLWSGVAKATTYRYLTKMTKLGLLKVEKRGYRNGFSHHYQITENGKNYLGDFMELGMIL